MSEECKCENIKRVKKQTIFKLIIYKNQHYYLPNTSALVSNMIKNYDLCA